MVLTVSRCGAALQSQKARSEGEEVDVLAGSCRQPVSSFAAECHAGDNLISAVCSWDCQHYLRRPGGLQLAGLRRALADRSLQQETSLLGLPVC